MLARLELNDITVIRNRKTWNLYFILATEHPEEPEKMVVTILPELPISLVPTDFNSLSLVPIGKGADGLILMERELPQKRSIRARIWVFHTRNKLRGAGELIEALQGSLGDLVTGTLALACGVAAPWLVLARTSISVLGQALQKLPDRQMGTIICDEVFDDEFIQDIEMDRQSSNKYIMATWTWSVSD